MRAGTIDAAAAQGLIPVDVRIDEAAAEEDADAEQGEAHNEDDEGRDESFEHRSLVSILQRYAEMFINVGGERFISSAASDFVGFGEDTCWPRPSVRVFGAINVHRWKCALLLPEKCALIAGKARYSCRSNINFR